MNIKPILKRSTEKGGMLNSIMVLFSGSLISQIVTVATAPIMTRVFTEEEIGEYTLLITAVALFGSVICAKYDYSIVNEHENKKIYPLIKLSLLVGFWLSVVLSISYSVYVDIFCEMMIPLTISVLIVFVFLFLTAVRNILTSYNNRERDYGVISRTTISSTIAKDGTMVAFGFLRTGVVGLILSQLFFLVVGLKRQAKKLIPNVKTILNIDRESIKEVAIKHKKQPLYSAPANLLNNFSYSIVNIFVSQLFGVAILAYYSLSFRLLGLPLSLISTNTSKAFYERASKDYAETGSFRNIYLKMSLFLLCLAIPMVIILMFFSPMLCRIVFGASWEVAGHYVQILAPMFGIRFIVSALTPSLTICNQQQYEFLCQALFVVAAFAILIIGKIYGSIDLFLIGMSISYSIIYIFFYVLMLRFSNKKVA